MRKFWKRQRLWWEKSWWETTQESLHRSFVNFMAYLGINRSQNRYLPMIGVVVAMQWLFCWIENFNLVPTMDLIIMYVVIMMCSSPFYRNLTDEEFEREMYDTFNINC